MIEIRNARRAEAQQIRDLIWRVQINPMSLDWRRFMVAVDESGLVAGCGQVKSHGDGTREMASIAVQPELQHQGIGTAVVQRLLAENSPPLYLTCRARMEPFYQRFGFATVAPEKLPPYFRRIFQAVAFFRRLSPRMEKMLVMLKED